ncbi:terminase [Cohnella sp. GCM10020058]|uniref:terminase n=1 Tax=Cohnella sp. GCM10020058 TaxID=3317330 RepID=UPI00363DB524
MPKNAQPIDVIQANGRKHLTKAEIRERQEGEVKLGKHELEKLKKPAFVSKDKTAAKLWNDLIKKYKSASEQGVDLLSSSDIGALALYCKTYSEYERLQERYQQIDRIQIDEDVLSDYLDQAEDVDGAGYKALKYLSQLASLDGALKIETAINKKMDMLLKLQDRLFLNPLAKIKNVPKPKKEEKAPSKFGRFGGAAGGGRGG